MTNCSTTVHNNESALKSLHITDVDQNSYEYVQKFMLQVTTERLMKAVLTISL